MSDSSKPRSQWRLQLDADLWVSQARARRVTTVDPEVVDHALAAAPAHRHLGARTWVFGFDAAGQLVRTCLPENTAGLTGERAAATRWLSGSPRAEWHRAKVTTPGTSR